MAANQAGWADIYFDPKKISSRARFASEHGPIATWFRQTPGHDGVFGQTAFTEQESRHPGEWLVVCDEPPVGLRSQIPSQRRILFVGEPPSIKVYPPWYLNQFGIVVGPIGLQGYKGTQVRQHGSLPWHYGRSRAFSWPELEADKVKSRLISVFCSDKTFNMHQVLRIRFVDKLKAHFGASIEHFGNGFRPIREKADGLSPFRYTIVLENNRDPGFWTEKLADAYLGGCFPIYAGGKIPSEDFDARSRLEIDLFKSDDALRAIENLIETANFDDLNKGIREQRRRVMLEHNLFAVAGRLIEARRGDTGLLPRAVEIARSSTVGGHEPARP